MPGEITDQTVTLDFLAFLSFIRRTHEIKATIFARGRGVAAHNAELG